MHHQTITDDTLRMGVDALAERDPDLHKVRARLETLDDEQGRSHLLDVPGLGPWTVDIYYMMALRRPDVWPQGDLALASAIQDIKQLDARPTRGGQLGFAEQWAPWRAVAARLLWMHYLDARGQ
ncbi:DNA-3-methyladenine glycosylase family protein [Marinobacter sp. F4206]|uniref:DNA-3-methyladenine glycosylase family protein n=1 Tax=Marinobacter sp. F4206 TaxID=2861777 RepID=UPI001C5EFA65|nr:hypothetical protein [Marinobacter sp. F4206]MBW4934171.1 hypothetical protein [Marinobacter sp. F4206]